MARVRQARRCRAQRKDGRPCSCYAVVGAYVCRMHGGTSPQARRKAQERLLEADIYRTFAAWSRSPAAREYWDRTALASDRPVIEAFAEQLSPTNTVR